MQPYFFPYAGYFRLFSHVDEFVLFDCVQFRRRGRIHRTEVPGADGALHWLTLPLAYCPRETLIRDVPFSTGARETLDQRLSAFDWIGTAPGETAQAIRSYLFGPTGRFVEFVEEGLILVARLLDLKVKFTRSSSFDLPAQLKGQDRILEILKRVEATHYVNLPGGRSLYDPLTFEQNGIKLVFMPDYTGPHMHMLHNLMTGDLAEIRRDVLAEEPLIPAADRGLKKEPF